MLKICEQLGKVIKIRGSAQKKVDKIWNCWYLKWKKDVSVTRKFSHLRFKQRSPVTMLNLELVNSYALRK